MDSRSRKRLRKILHAMLAKDPARFRLIGTADGWVEQAELVKALHEEGCFTFLTRKGLRRFLELYFPGDFEFDQGRIRAAGTAAPSRSPFHYQSATPPSLLHLAIRRRAALHIKRHGLEPGAGKGWIMLFTSRSDAQRTGRRWGAEELVEVDVQMAEAAGACFYGAGHGIYLTTWLPPSAISYPEELERFVREERQRRKEQAAARAVRGKRGEKGLSSGMKEPDGKVADASGQMDGGEAMPGSYSPDPAVLAVIYGSTLEDAKDAARKRFARKRSAGKRRKTKGAHRRR